MKKALCMAMMGVLLSCGGKKEAKKEAPVVMMGQWAESNIWGLRVDSISDKITPGMDRYYKLVYASVKNITQSEQPFMLQDMALVMLVERRDTAEMKYQIDGIVSQSEMNKRKYPVSTTVKAGGEIKVILAYSLPVEARPNLLKVNDGVGPKVSYVRLE
ncbi:MAG: hypothetical protein ABIM88_03050 [candidate division WOR-3 bacterium]